MHRTILITGAAGGIGSALTEAFIDEDTTLLLHSHDREIKHSSPHIHNFKADFADKTEISRMFSNICRSVKDIDVFINTVGIEEAAADQLDTEAWKRLFEINLFGAVECTRNVLRLMERKGGVIVHITSLAGVGGIVFKNSLAYSIAKAGLLKFTENLSLMTKPNIRVLSVTPGYTITPIWNSFTNEEKKACTKMVPIQRFIQPKEVAAFIINLIDSQAVTGGNYTIDGGLHLKECI